MMEVRLLGVQIASRHTVIPKIAEDGQVELDEYNLPVMIPVVDLIFRDPRTGDAHIIPLTENGVEAVKKAIAPQTDIVVPPPGFQM